MGDTATGGLEQVANPEAHHSE